MSGVFFDTNVLLYLLSDDAAKADTTEALLAERGFISVQVLNEAAAVCIRKFKMPWPEVRVFLDALKACCEVLPITLTTHESAVALAARYRLSFYDALICAAALESGAETLLSEDMHDGLSIGRLQLRNPFK